MWDAGVWMSPLAYLILTYKDKEIQVMRLTHLEGQGTVVTFLTRKWEQVTFKNANSTKLGKPGSVHKMSMATVFLVRLRGLETSNGSFASV